MSVPAKVVLGTSCVFAVAVIGYVHFKQAQDRQKLFEGVLKDIERQNRRKENIYILQKQEELTKQLREESESNNNALA